VVVVVVGAPGIVVVVVGVPNGGLPAGRAAVGGSEGVGVFAAPTTGLVTR
jgi:hypothetical protein